MTAPISTPATLDAAVVGAIAEQAHALIDAEHHADLCGCTLWPTDCHTYPGANVLFSPNAHDVVWVAAPLFAAAHADQLAQAHAAGTAEGSKAERERIAASLRTAADLHRIAAEDCLKATLAGGGAEFIAMWDRQHVNSLAAATALEEHAAAIARAGTSEANRG